jgi:hypothetical protein
LIGTKTKISFDGLKDEVGDHFGLVLVGAADEELAEEGLVGDL